MASLKSPNRRPTPRFYSETQTFSTKKERGTPREHPPPRPPIKSASSLRRFFHHKVPVQRAQAVSFRASDSSLLNKHYDECSKELYFDQCFTVESKLGYGSFGEVFKVKSKEDGKFYAIKKSREGFRGISDRKRKLEEVAKHEQLPKHFNCIRFIKAWEEQQHLYIQTELCETSLGNLSDSQHDIPEALIWNYLIDLLLAVKHLHDHELIHLDIKPANIFVTRGGICKLGDFGLVLDLRKNDLSEALEGDPKYLAPELLEGKFTKAADVFSLGITILELACDLDLPQGGDSWHHLRKGHIPTSLMSNVSSDLCHVITLMMHPDYQCRPSVNNLLDLSTMRKALRYRKRQIWLNATLTGAKEIVELVSAYFGMFWSLFTQPFVQLYKRFYQIPGRSPKIKIQKEHPAEWDRSFSDDEVSDDSAFLPDASLSTSIDSRNFSFPVSNNKLVNSTPMRASTPASRQNTPDSNPRHDWNSYRFSPTPSSEKHNSSGSMYSELMNTPRNVSSRHDESNYIIGPKNLTAVFDALAKDD